MILLASSGPPAGISLVTSRSSRSESDGSSNGRKGLPWASGCPWSMREALLGVQGGIRPRKRTQARAGTAMGCSRSRSSIPRTRVLPRLPRGSARASTPTHWTGSSSRHARHHDRNIGGTPDRRNPLRQLFERGSFVGASDPPQKRRSCTTKTFAILRILAR